MKFYVVRVKKQKNGVYKKSELMDYDSQQQALAKFYTNIGTDMNDDTLQGSMCAVLNERGTTIVPSVFWEREEEPVSEE